MNETILNLFRNFTVDGVSIPVKFMHYKGHGEPYVTFMSQDMNNSYAGDDDLLGYVEYYDFDIYSKGNIKKIIQEVKSILTGAGFTWQPSRSSMDLYEADTGYYHKTLNFAIPREE